MWVRTQLKIGWKDLLLGTLRGLVPPRRDAELQKAERFFSSDDSWMAAYSVRTGRTEPQVSIGKRIADRVRLSATTGLSEAREFRAVVEAQLDANTSVQAGYDNYNLTSASSFGRSNKPRCLRWWWCSSGCW